MLHMTSLHSHNIYSHGCAHARRVYIFDILGIILIASLQRHSEITYEVHLTAPRVTIAGYVERACSEVGGLTEKKV